MTATHRRRLAAVMALTGATAMTVGAASLPATGVEDKPAPPMVERPELDDPETDEPEADEDDQGRLDDEESGEEPDEGDGPDLDAATMFAEPGASGAEALAQLEDPQLEVVAQRAGMSVSRLASYLEQDQAIVSPGGLVAFVDEWSLPDHLHDAESLADVPGDPESGSRPGAAHTVFIDFDGHTIENTEWNRYYEAETIEISPYRANARAKREIWERIAQDYAPFDVNVTISDPGHDALYKTSPDDATYGAHLVIAPDRDELPADLQNAGGQAFVSTFGMEFASPAIVVADNLMDHPEHIAKAGSHEVGHTLGLEHHGIGDDEYYYGGPVPSPDALWGPIMGAPYDIPLATWSDGGYADATNPGQDDIARITDRTAVSEQLVLFDGDGNLWVDAYCTTGDPNQPQPGDEFYELNDEETCDPPGPPLTDRWDYADRTSDAADPHGDAVDDATTLDNSTGDFSEDGVIVAGGDTDVFVFTTDGGPFTATAAPVGVGPNLDIKLTLLDGDGEVLAEEEQETAADPSLLPDGSRAEGLDATIEEELEIGRYYLMVEGRGQGDPADNQPDNGCCYPSYGSLGFYSLTGEAEPFDAEPVVIASPEDGDEVMPNNLQVSGTAEPTATVSLTIDDDVVAEATADDAGEWIATLTDDLPYGDSTLTAQQTVASIEVPETDSVTVTVPLEAPEITKPNEGDVARIAAPTFTGTGVAGATVTVSIECGDFTHAGAVAADEDGEWSFVPEEGLPDGECSVSAVQEIDGVTSPSSEPVNFTVEVDTPGDDDGAEDGTEDGDDGAEDGTEDGDGDDLPDTGAASMTTLIAGLLLLLLGGLLYARTGRGTA